MNKDMYDLVKTMVKDGKSLDDIVDEVNAMAHTAKKELTPKTPIADKYGKPAATYTYNATYDGKIDLNTLVSFMAVYFVQNGFKPDECFESDEEFRDHLTAIIDAAFDATKRVADMYKNAEKRVSDNARVDTCLHALRDMIFDLLRF